MKRFVVDNSVVMSWCFEDEQSAQSQRFLRNLKTMEALVPALWPFEIANGLLMAERHKRISLDEVIKFLGFLKQLPIRTEGLSINDEAWLACYHIGRDHHLSAYDASYLYLAHREKVPLATFDTPMIKAARDLKISIL